VRALRAVLPKNVLKKPVGRLFVTKIRPVENAHWENPRNHRFLVP
jgi:hypothetical protein